MFSLLIKEINLFQTEEELRSIEKSASCPLMGVPRILPAAYDAWYPSRVTEASNPVRRQLRQFVSDQHGHVLIKRKAK